MEMVTSVCFRLVRLGFLCRADGGSNGQVQTLHNPVDAKETEACNHDDNRLSERLEEGVSIRDL